MTQFYLPSGGITNSIIGWTTGTCVIVLMPILGRIQAEDGKEAALVRGPKLVT